MSGTFRMIQIAAATLALVFALLLGAGGSIGIQGASALTIGTENGGWTPENFRTSCEAAGGRHIPIDQGDLKYSRCVFRDGTSNRCDWIKKICTFGIVTGPFKNGTYTAVGTVKSR